jgi:hypothetical protein
MVAVVLAGCGKGPAFNAGATLDNPAPSAALSIAFQSTPAASVPLGLTTDLTAVVSNDPYNYGVDWSLTCASSECGALSLLHTDSNQATTYTPPSTFAGGQLAVNIVAFATADHTKNILASINVTAFFGKLDGTYVFQAQGSNADTRHSSAVRPYQIAGVVTLDGNGGVVGGEQTFSDSFRSGSAVITGGNYTLAADGRGMLTLNTSDSTLGPASNKGTETFSLVYLNSSKSLIAQSDSSASAAGTMDLQTGTAAPSGGYAFAVSGTGSAGVPVAFGGVFNVDKPNSGTISGVGSVADQGYFGTVNGKATVSVQNCPAPAGLSGTVLPLPADAFGSLQLTLHACFAASPLQFTGYVVDPTHIKLIETDIGAKTGFAASGIAIGQGTATGAFTGAPSFSGTYVFGISGLDGSKSAASLASAGGLVADGAGNLQGAIDEFGRSGSPDFSGEFNGTYTVDSSGAGRLNASTSLADGAGGPELVFYLTGNGNPALLVLGFDPAAPAVGAGMAYAQASPPLQPSGDYGLNAFNSNKQLTLANDVTGQMTMTLDPTTNASAVAGLLDDSRLFGFPITGDFQATSTGGDYSGTIYASNATSKLQSPMTLDLYLVDDSHGFLVETDSAASGSTFLGYVAARTPVCPVCP